MSTAPVQQAALQICQPGYDIRTAPDWAFLFNSNWPSLTIAFEKTVTGPITVNHKLGFPPLAMAWFSSTNSYSREFFEVDKQNVYVTGSGIYTVRCFNIDISTEASYALPTSAGAKLPYDNQFGLKLAKNNRAITSNNLNDFIIHTRGQSPAVLEIATEKGQYLKQTNDPSYWPYGNVQTWDLIVYPLPTSYIPWNVGAIDQGSDTYALQAGQAVYYSSVHKSLVLNITATGSGSLIVLRDPLFYPNTVRVVY